MQRYAVTDSNGNILRTVYCSEAIKEQQKGSDGYSVLQVAADVRDNTHKVDKPGKADARAREFTQEEKDAREAERQARKDAAEEG